MPPITLLPLNERDIHFVLSTRWGESQREGPIRRLDGRQSGRNSMLIPPYVLVSASQETIACHSEPPGERIQLI